MLIQEFVIQAPMKIIKSSVILRQSFYLSAKIETLNKGKNDKIECIVTVNKGIPLQCFWLKGHRPITHRDLMSYILRDFCQPLG